MLPPFFPDHELRGLHGEGAAAWMLANGVRGWAVETVYADQGLQTPKPVDFSVHQAAGIRVLVRWNLSYASSEPGGGGTLPPREQYDAFARWCADSILRSRGVWGHIIANEPNRPAERPAPHIPITADDAADAFNRVWQLVPRTVRLSPAAVDPTNAESGEPRGYFRQMVSRLFGADFFALHGYAYGSDQPPSSDMRFTDHPMLWQFRAFRMWEPLADVLHDEFPRFRNTPLIVTETNHLYLRGSGQTRIGWDADASGWIRDMYDYVRRWNESPGDQYVHGVCLYRFEGDDLRLQDKPALLDSLRQSGAEALSDVLIRSRLSQPREESTMPFRLIWPVRGVPQTITQPFGARPEFYSQFGLPGHEGIDFFAPVRTPVVAAADGRVTQIVVNAPPSDFNRNYGTYLRIQHNTPDDGVYQTIYAHLLSVRDGLKVGDMVKAGDNIGLADNTGLSQGSHLHLTLKKIGATAAGLSKFVTPDGKVLNYRNDVIDPTPYLDRPGAVVVNPPKPVDDLRYLADGDPLDGTTFSTGQKFSKSWTIRNSGTRDWGPGYRLVFEKGFNLGDQNEVPLPALKPGQDGSVTVSMTAPSTPGSYRSQWKAKAPDGTLFGTSVSTQINAAAPTVSTPKPPPNVPLPVQPGTNNLAFVEDVTVPDDTRLGVGSRFTKIWRVRNTGATTWGQGYRFSHLGNANLASVFTINLPPAKPGEEVQIVLEMTVPPSPGVHKSTWQALTPDGKRFGQEIYVKLRVILPQA